LHLCSKLMLYSGVARLSVARGWSWVTPVPNPKSSLFLFLLPSLLMHTLTRDVSLKFINFWFSVRIKLHCHSFIIPGKQTDNTKIFWEAMTSYLLYGYKHFYVSILCSIPIFNENKLYTLHIVGYNWDIFSLRPFGLFLRNNSLQQC